MSDFKKSHSNLYGIKENLNKKKMKHYTIKSLPYLVQNLMYDVSETCSVLSCKFRILDFGHTEVCIGYSYNTPQAWNSYDNNTEKYTKGSTDLAHLENLLFTLRGGKGIKKFNYTGIDKMGLFIGLERLPEELDFDTDNNKDYFNQDTYIYLGEILMSSDGDIFEAFQIKRILSRGKEEGRIRLSKQDAEDIILRETSHISNYPAGSGGYHGYYQHITLYKKVE